MDEFFNSVINDFVDDEEHDKRRSRSRGAKKVSSTKCPTLKYVKLVESGEQNFFNEGTTHTDKEQQLKAMQEDMNSPHENYTY